MCLSYQWLVSSDSWPYIIRHKALIWMIFRNAPKSSTTLLKFRLKPVLNKFMGLERLYHCENFSTRFVSHSHFLSPTKSTFALYHKFWWLNQWTSEWQLHDHSQPVMTKIQNLSRSMSTACNTQLWTLWTGCCKPSSPWTHGFRIWTNSSENRNQVWKRTQSTRKSKKPSDERCLRSSPRP